MRNLDQKKFIEFFKEPRTLAEAKNFARGTVSAKDLHSFKLPQGYSLFEQKTDRDDSLFVVNFDKHPIQGRTWRFWQSPKQPYMWVQFPQEMPHNKIKIVPLSDVHYGAKAHNYKKFHEYLKWIETNPDAYTFLNGDIIENAIDGSVGGSVYESNMTPEEQIWGTHDGTEPGIIELLRPIAHKILWAQPGNHEWRSWRKVNIDPLKIVCRELGIPYFNEPIYADVLAWGHKFTFYCHHGVTGSMTKGGKLNAAMRPTSFQESVDFVVMGHVHDSMVNDTTRIVRKRSYDNDNNVVSFSLEQRAQYVVICPSFYGYFNSYGSRAGFSPGSWGSVSCTLFNDGTYRASA